MAYTFKKNLEDSILLFEAADDYSVQKEIQDVVIEANDILDTIEKPVFMILDFSRAKLNIQDVLVGSTKAARGESTPFHHPNVRQVIFVTDNRALEMTAKGMSSATFGRLNIPVFRKYDDALNYIHAQKAQDKS